MTTKRILTRCGMSASKFLRDFGDAFLGFKTETAGVDGKGRPGGIADQTWC